jgi:dihydroorotate dehydrogenase
VLPDTFKASLDPSLFRLYRKYLYSRHMATKELSQAEVIHEVAKERLAKMADKFRKNESYFDPGPQLAVNVAGHALKSPIGIAAGFDKDCEMLEATSYVFGYLNPGSVLKDPRKGNPQRRLAVDDGREALINAQGYPHKGLDYSVRNLRKFAEGPRGKAKVLLNFSGITETYTEDAVLDACKEIIKQTAPYVDFGFEDNRASPNTDFNKKLQTPEFTKKMMDLMNSHVPKGLVKASKIASYSSLPPTDAERSDRLESIRVFYENGGNAIVLGNTRPVETANNRLTKDFARPVAGESGRPLFPYMLRMVEDVHRRFPDLAIIASGGIWDGNDAWQAIQKGATLVQLYTALTFRGFGVVREIHDTLKDKLAGKTLQGFIEGRR